MRILFLITLYLIIFSNMAFAGEIYTWTYKKGLDHITTAPPPEYAKVKDRSTFKRDDPREIEAFQRKQKAAIDRGFAGWQNSQKRSRTASSPSIQDSREARAQKLIEDNRKRIEAVQRGPIKISSQQRELIEKAAEIKAQQIREGTDMPMTAQEDAAFHAREAAEDAIRWHELRSQ